MAYTCSGFIEPLNLQCLLMNIFAGSAILFCFLGFIFISVLGAKFRMRNDVLMIMFVLWSILFSTYIAGIYLIIMVIIGLIVITIIRRVVTSQ